MIDELAYAGPEHLDAAFVAGFDRKQGYPDPAEDLDALAAQGLGAGSTVVDLGTGTGQFALAAARRFGHVTAVVICNRVVAAIAPSTDQTNGLSPCSLATVSTIGLSHSTTGIWTRSGRVLPMRLARLMHWWNAS